MPGSFCARASCRHFAGCGSCRDRLLAEVLLFVHLLGLRNRGARDRRAAEHAEATEGAHDDVPERLVGHAAIGTALVRQVQEDAAQEVAQADAQQPAHDAEAHGIREVHLLRQDLPCQVLEQREGCAEGRAEEGRDRVVGVVPGLPLLQEGEAGDQKHDGAEDEHRDHQQAASLVEDLRGGRHRHGARGGAGFGRLARRGLRRVQRPLLGLLRVHDGDDARRQGRGAEEHDGATTEVLLHHHGVRDADQVSHDQQQEEHRRGAQAEDEDREARPGETAPVRNGDEVGLHQ
mmetsp:Transcript_25993/g.72961  ORF Transcript_25993/g.72961 Transcript_25993/m.72961 type:complete len:290 (-) Transcript_25993:284-1153(-)